MPLAKTILSKAVEISQQSAFWHCRLLFQLAVSVSFFVNMYNKMKNMINIKECRDKIVNIEKKNRVTNPK